MGPFVFLGFGYGEASEEKKRLLGSMLRASNVSMYPESAFNSSHRLFDFLTEDGDCMRRPQESLLAPSRLWSRKFDDIELTSVEIGAGVFYPDGPVYSAKQKAQKGRVDGNFWGSNMIRHQVLVSASNGTIIAVDPKDKDSDITIETRSACITSFLLKQLYPFTKCDIVCGDVDGCVVMMTRQRTLMRHNIGASISALHILEPKGDVDGNLSLFSELELKWRHQVGGIGADPMCSGIFKPSDSLPRREQILLSGEDGYIYILAHWKASEFSLSGLSKYAELDHEVTNIKKWTKPSDTNLLDSVFCAGHFDHILLYRDGLVIMRLELVDWALSFALGDVNADGQDELVVVLADSTVEVFTLSSSKNDGVANMNVEISESDESRRQQKIVEAITAASESDTPHQLLSNLDPVELAEEEGEIDEEEGQI
ncbi:hypothetical protein HDU97_003609 [Phlyctochytrium planicorne]|nr:hypothetical protein HDU97_003609 [Phlyctochytrium planicorne]